MKRRQVSWHYLLVALAILGFGLIWGLGDQSTRGTFLVFLVIVPIFFAAFGNFLLSGYSKSASVGKRLNLFGVVLFDIAALLGFIAILERDTRPIALMGFVLASTAFCAGSFIVAIFGQRKDERTLSCCTWSLMATSFYLLPASLLLEFAVVLSLSGLQPAPSRLSTSAAADLSSGGLFLRHAFWFLGHPEVVVLLFFVGGWIAEFLRLATRRFASGSVRN